MKKLNREDYERFQDDRLGLLEELHSKATNPDSIVILDQLIATAKAELELAQESADLEKEFEVTEDDGILDTLTTLQKGPNLWQKFWWKCAWIWELLGDSLDFLFQTDSRSSDQIGFLNACFLFTGVAAVCATWILFGFLTFVITAILVFLAFILMFDDKSYINLLSCLIISCVILNATYGWVMTPIILNNGLGGFDQNVRLTHENGIITEVDIPELFDKEPQSFNNDGVNLIRANLLKDTEWYGLGDPRIRGVINEYTVTLSPDERGYITYPKIIDFEITTTPRTFTVGMSAEPFLNPKTGNLGGNGYFHDSIESKIGQVIFEKITSGTITVDDLTPDIVIETVEETFNEHHPLITATVTSVIITEKRVSNYTLDLDIPETDEIVEQES